ncbi:MAG: molybdopterin molybdotransferase MoeA [Deltaproteobacteria bacterium]|nr:molybdopterin molybdotransferase MoeA [Deltaproteobacteria bacterium]
MISVYEAIEVILNQISPLSGEEVPILQAAGRVLCEDVCSRRSVPPFSNSAMDGYAVRWQDVAEASPANPVTLRILESVPAGYVAKRRVVEGSAIKIMTGAPLPRGADTVVRVEHTESAGDDVRINRVDGSGSHIREAGEDIQKGQMILEKGKVLSPADIGLMASVGKSRVRVYRRPTVGVISTGDELLEVGDRPRAGKIVNSNSYTLAAAIRETGAISVALGIVRDKRKSLASVFKRALRYDAVITSGGISMGDYDLVKEALGDVGVEMQFWHVAQRPGHPMAFGRIGRKPVFGLPGNPVSSAVSFLLYARPALLKLMGHRNLFLPVIQATLEHEIKKSRGVKEFIRCRLRFEEGRSFASSTGAQGAGMLRSLSLAQGLIVAGEEQTFLEEGSQVPVILLNHHDLLQSEAGF